MRSSLLLGVGAWLLGAAAATTGSMIAVNQLAHGLLGPQTQQLTEASISADPDARTDLASPSAAATPTPSAARPTSAAARPRAAADRPRRDASATRPAVEVPPSASATPSPSQTGAAKLLQSPDGSVMAECRPAGAYLMYWSPDQGFQADDVVRGPAAVARVTFETRTSGIVMRVSCSGGTPTAQLSHDT